MALIHLAFTHGALPVSGREALGRQLGRLAYSAEGFESSQLAPELTWTIFDEKPRGTFATAHEGTDKPLYYVAVMTLAGALSIDTKHVLGRQIAQALVEAEGSVATPDNLVRVWVHFGDVIDGDLVVGGESTSLAGLRRH
jgi:hypothetical protein